MLVRKYNLIMAAQVHEGKEAEQSVVVGIEVAVLERFMLGIPEGVHKLLALVVRAHHRGGCRGGYEADAMAQLAETAGTQNLVALGHGAVLAVLVEELVHTLAIEEVLNLLAILPFIGTRHES